ncbi:1-deoxy-D-xylulose-5-phosphate reductoisomerase [Clostridium intestinale]|uniref:1-deoxy-D-xylulose 5-phosphate reductoisomerase n=1 Tax=Clostridium intestinale URNW TaxID=1294142 RepID=U2N756_9CLOT|nr:1-deoxy-D-xylulose-5-phosphate reductoisomerase [Clostridium intestinale]ERK31352.1 1-deoxy-D-xylulose 5-phosphate reductoisomerase [Clostridium intestinale URNW]
MKKISILGVTGSVGTQALDVIRFHRETIELVAASAFKNFEKMIEILEEFKPKYIVLEEDYAYNKLENYIKDNKKEVTLLKGIDGLKKIASLSEIDVVLTSVVGMIGLEPTLEAIRAGKDIALANKETLVVAGAIVMEEAKKYGVKILPVDSEHGAIFQCLNGEKYEDINKILLTASGGPFRGKVSKELEDVTFREALKHPNWSMGRKISIDSATLMNKGLEVIEAHWLFNVPFEKIQVVVHPQSIVHSMVEFKDASVIAQISSTDMKLPIQYALNYPNRESNICKELDFWNLANLSFEKPDFDTFKCLKLAFDAGKIGGIMPTILNGANEVLVELFLEEKVKFLEIPEIIEECMNRFYVDEYLTIEGILSTDKLVRSYIYEKYS